MKNIPWKRIFLFSFFMLILYPALCQKTNNMDVVYWIADRKLTIDDFGIKRKLLESSSSFAQFTISYKAQGFSFLQKNFNKNVQNEMLKSASWIDPNSDTLSSIKYQQTLFDLAEIYTRLFRKALKENKKKSLSGLQYTEDLSQQIMTKFANRRIKYDEETNTGRISDKQTE